LMLVEVALENCPGVAPASPGSLRGGGRLGRDGFWPGGSLQWA
jgi:hypothetical protein